MSRLIWKLDSGGKPPAKVNNVKQGFSTPDYFALLLALVTQASFAASPSNAGVISGEV